MQGSCADWLSSKWEIRDWRNICIKKVTFSRYVYRPVSNQWILKGEGETLNRKYKIAVMGESNFGKTVLFGSYFHQITEIITQLFDKKTSSSRYRCPSRFQLFSWQSRNVYRTCWPSRRFHDEQKLLGWWGSPQRSSECRRSVFLHISYDVINNLSETQKESVAEFDEQLTVMGWAFIRETRTLSITIHFLISYLIIYIFSLL